MLKPASLRAALTAAVPHLQKNPQALHIYIEEGSVRSTMSGGLSFEYSYTLTATLTDYADHADLLIVPIIAWLRWQQPDMLLNPELVQDGFSFEVDLLGNDKCDIQIKLKLTERVLVTQALLKSALPGDGSTAPGTPPAAADTWDQSWADEDFTKDAHLKGAATLATITHAAEPVIGQVEKIERWQFFIDGVLMQEWETRPFSGPVTP